MRLFKGPRRAGVAVAGCCLLAVGVLGGAALSSLTLDSAPEELVDPGEVVVEVAISEVDDSRRVTLAVTLAGGDPLVSNVAGRVTGAACEPGAELHSGEVVGAVDGVDIRLLATSVPLWRDLRSGDRGADVAAVQVELRRWGYSSVTESGRLDAATAAALRDWLAGTDAQRWASYARGDSALALPLSAVVWSPTAMVTVRQCGLRPGTGLAVGDAVVTPVPRVMRITVTDGLPPPPAGRTRLLGIGAVTVPIDESGVVADEDGLALLTATPEFAAWLDTADERQLSGTVRLDAPVLVGAVPPAAVIIGAGADEACLIDPDGRSVPVRIMSSQLGLTLVVPVAAGASLPARVVVDRDGSGRCGLS